jgi:hypothetical protein
MTLALYRYFNYCIVVLLSASSLLVSAFLTQTGASASINIARPTRWLSSKIHDEAESALSVIGVVAPLRYVGPYACLGLNFPNIRRNPGVEINFVLDTAANVNTISSEIANELDLPILVKGDDLSLLGSAGAGGTFKAAGDIVWLGDSRLSGMPENQSNNTFMTNMTAAAMSLGIANSVGGGMLGSQFFNCFKGGVEFDWYGTDGDPPTLIFYHCLPDYAKENASCVSIKTDEFFGLPTVSVKINGKELRAIIDTGSPITIVSPSVASDIGISKEDGMIKIKGVDDGAAMGLSKSLDEVSLSIGDAKLNLPSIFIRELPGLAMASKLLGVDSHQPQVLLGLDTLRRTYRMILRMSEGELWLEELQ